MRTKAFCTVATLSAFLSAAIADDDVDKELKSLAGTWKVVSIEAEGKKAPLEALEKLTWVIKDKNIEFVGPNAAKDDSKATFEIDPSKSPKEIDLTSAGGANKGKTMEGIYELKDGKLKVSMRDLKSAAEGRPTEFEGGVGMGLIVLEKVVVEQP